MRGVPRERRAISLAPSDVARHLQHLGRATHDQLERVLGVVVQPFDDAEARAHRRRQHAEARGRADEREVLDGHRDRLRLRPLAEPDVDLVVLHRGVEELLDDGAQPVDLVDEEDVPLTHVRELPHEVARLLDRRPARRVDVHAHLARDQLGQRRLAEARRAVEERVVERLLAGDGGRDRDPQVALDLLLADELGQPLRSQGELDDALLADDLWGRDLGSGHGCNIPGLSGTSKRMRSRNIPEIARKSRCVPPPRQTRARIPASRSAAASSVSGFLQKTKRISDLPSPSRFR
jgi:hypothetical protein